MFNNISKKIERKADINALLRTKNTLTNKTLLPGQKCLKRTAKEFDLQSMISVVSVDTPPCTGRLSGGANDPNVRKVENILTSKKKCRDKPPDSYYHKPNPCHTITELKLNTENLNLPKFNYVNCKQYKEKVEPLSQTRGCQTLYRESSAQTLPYLPGISNEVTEQKNLEIFKLAKILKGDKPPGLYEVEILERARKRWAFAASQRQRLKKQMEENRENIKQYQSLMEFFEWENWIEREENIQETQMQRFETVIRMFNEREKQIYEETKARLQMGCTAIMNKHQKAKQKHQNEYDRTMRRLEMKHRRVSRVWRKQSIVKEFSDPCSEFYAPQMRYGVNPSRRHFKPKCTDSLSGVDNIEKETNIDMNILECPFEKLKRWSTPKGPLKEAEQNFCSDRKLSELYNGLKILRQYSTKIPKPKSLIKRQGNYIYDHDPIVLDNYKKKQKLKKLKKIEDMKKLNKIKFLIQMKRMKKMSQTKHMKKTKQKLIERMNSPVKATVTKTQSSSKIPSKPIRKEDRSGRMESILFAFYKDSAQLMEIDQQTFIELEDELHGYLRDYMGNALGGIMEFTGKELEKFKEEQELFAMAMLAQNERWRREAAEAGLRQRENALRIIWEEQYEEAKKCNLCTSNLYADQLCSVEISLNVDNEVTKMVSKVGKVIDRDLNRWISFFHEVDSPYGVDNLMRMFRDLLYPPRDSLKKQYEAHAAVHDFIECALFPRIYSELEPYDIANVIANATVDRLIDNDLHYISSDCYSEDSTMKLAEKESKAIIRKVIRYAVPGRRWKTTEERAGIETTNDVVDHILDEMEKRPSLWEQKFHGFSLKKKSSYYNIFDKQTMKEGSSSTQLSENSTLEDKYEFDRKSEKKLQSVDRNAITKALVNEEQLQTFDPSYLSMEKHIENVFEYDSIDRFDDTGLANLRQVTSAFDIMSLGRFKAHPEAETSESISSSYSETLSQVFRFGAPNVSMDVIKRLIRSIIPAEDGDSTGTVSNDGEEEEKEEEEEEAEKDEGEQENEELSENLLEPILSDLINTVEVKTPPPSSASSYVSEATSLIFTDSQLAAILEDRCKCKEDRDFENKVRALIAKGKVRVKEILAEEHSIEPFKYESDEKSVETESLKTQSKSTSETIETLQSDESFYEEEFSYYEDVDEDDDDKTTIDEESSAN